MPRLVTKFGYLKQGKRKSPGGYARYFIMKMLLQASHRESGRGKQSRIFREQTSKWFPIFREWKHPLPRPFRKKAGPWIAGLKKRCAAAKGVV